MAVEQFRDENFVLFATCELESNFLSLFSHHLIFFSGANRNEKRLRLE